MGTESELLIKNTGNHHAKLRLSQFLSEKILRQSNDWEKRRPGSEETDEKKK